MKTLLILLIIPVLAFGQWKVSGGKLVPSDTTRTVKVNTLEQDTPNEQYYQYVPYFVETATGSAWMGAAYNQNWFGFQVNEYITPDSVSWYFINTLAATDSFRVAIYDMADSTLICYTAWGSPNATSTGNLWSQAFTTTVLLKPWKTYALMYSHNTNTTLPTMDIVNNAQWYANVKRLGIVGTLSPSAWFADFPATLAGSNALSPSKVPLFVIKRTGTP